MISVLKWPLLMTNIVQRLPHRRIVRYRVGAHDRDAHDVYNGQRLRQHRLELQHRRLREVGDAIPGRHHVVVHVTGHKVKLDFLSSRVLDCGVVSPPGVLLVLLVLVSLWSASREWAFCAVDVLCDVPLGVAVVMLLYGVDSVS